MKLINKALILLFWIIITIGSAKAQTEYYQMELGGVAGISFYMGDANYSVPFKHPGFSGGAIGRYILNPRMAIKGNFIVGRISGNTASFDNKYPNNQNVAFGRTIFDLGAQYEYNFFGYSSEENYTGNKRFTPYILGGVGFTYAPAPADHIFTVNFPVGVGVKYKIAPRINIGCEFTMRFSLSDKLDVANKQGLQLNNPYGIKGKGLKNKDNYSFTFIFVTYDLLLRCRGCNKN